MAEPTFFPRAGPFTIRALATLVGAECPDTAAERTLTGVAALEAATPDELAYVDSPKLASALARTAAGAVLVDAKAASAVPPGTVALVVGAPARAFMSVAMLFHPGVERPGPVLGTVGVSPEARVAPTARIEAGATVEPGAVVGAGAAIGTGTVIAPGAVIGPGVQIGRDGSIGPNTVIQHALLGDRVIVHPGVCIGQDGFGYAMSARGHAKLPQMGRVIIQNDVEIGASTTIDRGAFRDTVIGEGTKIDNQVQIAHNVAIGRHCIIVAQVGIAGSCTLGDFVVIGGGAAVADHVTVGAGAQIAAAAGVMNDVPPGARWAGVPAQNARDTFREVIALRKLARGVKNEG